MERCLPPERWTALAAAARASRSERVLVICADSAVRRQYEAAIPKLGGNLANIVFYILTTERTLP